MTMHQIYMSVDLGTNYWLVCGGGGGVTVTLVIMEQCC
jgi:hypothetical protein